MSTLTVVLVSLAFVTLVVLAHAGANAIAYGRHPRRRRGEALRAEDAVETRARGNCDIRDTAAEAISATQYDRKRFDLSGIGGF
jgi:hypothetical protein